MDSIEYEDIQSIYSNFTGGAGGSTLRLLPPLTVTSDQIDRFIRVLKLIATNK